MGCSSWIRAGLQIIHVSKHIQYKLVARCRMIPKQTANDLVFITVAKLVLNPVSDLTLSRSKMVYPAFFLTFISILSLSSHRELYPSLAKSLQLVHRVLDSSNPLLPLQIQRVQALISLLTQVTNTAGCHQELRTSMVRYRSGL